MLGLSLSLLAQDFKNEFGFKSDNDSYLGFGSDRYYTNGLFINFRHAINQNKLSPKTEKIIYEINAGQKMYNPYSGYAPNPTKQDRPFAGYLYGGFALSWFHKNESILKAEVQIGTIGPDTRAEQAQELLHKTVGFYAIDGWQYQVSDEIAINLSAQYTKRLLRADEKDLDLSLETYGNLGNTFSGAGAGVVFRYGKINQLFNTAYTNSIISNNAKTKPFANKEFFFYAKPQLNLVAYDATLQGGMFSHTSPITFKPQAVVFAQQIGLNYSSRRFTADFSLLFKTKEVKSSARAHQWGSVSMYYRWGK